MIVDTYHRHCKSQWFVKCQLTPTLQTKVKKSASGVAESAYVSLSVIADLCVKPVYTWKLSKWIQTSNAIALVELIIGCYLTVNCHGREVLSPWPLELCCRSTIGPQTWSILETLREEETYYLACSSLQPFLPCWPEVCHYGLLAPCFSPSLPQLLRNQENQRLSNYIIIVILVTAYLLCVIKTLTTTHTQLYECHISWTSRVIDQEQWINHLWTLAWVLRAGLSDCSGLKNLRNKGKYRENPF